MLSNPLLPRSCFLYYLKSLTATRSKSTQFMADPKSHTWDFRMRNSLPDACLPACLSFFPCLSHPPVLGCQPSTPPLSSCSLLPGAQMSIFLIPKGVQVGPPPPHTHRHSGTHTHTGSPAHLLLCLMAFYSYVILQLDSCRDGSH